jgi:cell division protein FtsW (lipid II flippase)
MKKIIRGNYAEGVNNLFQTLLVTYLILLLTEQIWRGIVSLYLNLNYLLIAVIVIGVLDVFSEHSEVKNKKPKPKDYIFIFLLSIIGFLIIKFKTSELEWLSWIISFIAAILMILLSILVLNKEEKNE